MSAPLSGGGMLTPEHEVVSFASFLEYRARRLHPPVVAAAADPPDGVTTPTVPGPHRRVPVIACVDPQGNA